MAKKITGLLLALTFIFALAPFALADDRPTVVICVDDTDNVVRNGFTSSSSGLNVAAIFGQSFTHYFSSNEPDSVKYKAPSTISGWYNVEYFGVRYGTTAEFIEAHVSSGNGTVTNTVPINFYDIVPVATSTTITTANSAWIPCGVYQFAGNPDTEYISINIATKSVGGSHRSFAVRFTPAEEPVIEPEESDIYTIDDQDCAVFYRTNEWIEDTTLNGPDGAAVTHKYTQTPEDWVQYNLSPEQGFYDVSVYALNYTGDGTSSASIQLNHAGGSSTLSKDFSTAPVYDDIGAWVSVGEYYFAGSPAHEYIKLTLVDGILRTYAIKLTPVAQPGDIQFSVEDPEFTMSIGEDVWKSSTTLAGPDGANQLHYYTASATAYGDYSAADLPYGTYELYVYAIKYGPSAPNDVKVSVNNSEGEFVSHIDYASLPSQYQWVYIGRYEMAGSTGEFVRLQIGGEIEDGKQIRVSSIKFTPVAPAEAVATNGIIVRAGSPQAGSPDSWYSSATELLDDGVTPARFHKKADKTYSFSAQSLTAGVYEVFYYRIKSSPASLDDNKVRAYISSGGEIDVKNVSFAIGGRGWTSLGVYNFAGQSADEFVKIQRLQSDVSAKITYATAVKFVPVTAASANNTIELYAVGGEVQSSFSGTWGINSSGIMGPDGKTRSSHSSVTGSALTFAPPSLPKGFYELSFYKIVNNSDPAISITVVHNGKSDNITLDTSQGENGYVSLGYFDFAGGGSGESIVVKRTSTDSTSTRAVSVKLVGAAFMPDVINNVLGKDITITYDEHPGFNITDVKVDGTSKSFTAANGSITLGAADFPTAGDYEITISAQDQADATITQKINAVPATITTSKDTDAWRPQIPVSGNYKISINAVAESGILSVKTAAATFKKAIEVSAPGQISAGVYYFPAGTAEITASGLTDAGDVTLEYVEAAQLIPVKITLGDYADTLIDLVEFTGKLSIEAELYNETDAQAEPPIVYAAIYDGDGALASISLIDAVNSVIKAGGKAVYIGAIPNVTFESGGKVSLFIWDGNMSPISSSHANIYN